MPLVYIQTPSIAANNRIVDLFVSTIKTLTMSTKQTQDNLLETLEYIGNSYLYWYNKKYPLINLMMLSAIIDEFTSLITREANGYLYGIEYVCNASNNPTIDDKNALIILRTRSAKYYQITLKLMTNAEFDEYYKYRD